MKTTMRTFASMFALLSIGVAGFAAHSATAADTVKITPLGSHDGEFCGRDRAMIFEDPNGTRILYDAGRTIRGTSDDRLGAIDGVLLSHVHGDHLGDVYTTVANNGPCANPTFPESAQPYSMTAMIAVEKSAQIIVGGEMNFFLSPKLTEVPGGPNGASVVLVRFGANYNLNGVKITTVPAVHSNGLDPGFVPGALGTAFADHGMTIDVGPPTGYVVQFTNGLVAYLSGDTGITAEQDHVVRDYYHANLAVINIGDVFTTGPTEAAYVIDRLVKPKSVIPSHANEQATSGGVVIPGTKTATFINAVHVPAYVPLSGITMEFNGHGRCVAGCVTGHHHH